MDDRSRSILLQVAFKAAVEVGEPTKEKVISFFELLTSLHTELGIEPEASTRSSGNRRTPSRPSAPKPEGETFIYNGVLVEDFRAAKAAAGSTIKPNYPDFKTVNGEAIEGVTTDRGAAWMYDQDGQPNEDVAPLVEAADTKVL